MPVKNLGSRLSLASLPGFLAAVRRTFLLFLLPVLAACQTSSTEVLEDAASGPVRADEKVGEGGVVLALLLPRSAGGETGRRARDIRDGAALALSDLGDGKVSMIVLDTGGRPGDVAGLVAKAGEAGARLVLGPVTNPAATAFVAVDAGQRPPAIMFVGNGGMHAAGAFALATDAVDSALEGVRVAAGAGHKNFAVILPQGFSDADAQRLARGIAEAKVQLVGSVSYSRSGVTSQVAASREMLVKADGIVIFGDGDAPAAVAAALRAASALQPGAVLVGNSSWARSNDARPELDGTLLAMPDQNGLAVIADRYKSATSRTLSIDAAYGYDAIAVAAGLVRTVGEGALTTTSLTRPSGFRATTGIFRFNADGSVTRSLALYQIKGGALTLIDPPSAGF